MALVTRAEHWSSACGKPLNGGMIRSGNCGQDDLKFETGAVLTRGAIGEKPK